jgi:hypothetical protein
MSVSRQHAPSSQSPAVAAPSSSTSSGATDMASFSAESAPAYQASLGNQGVCDAAGMSGEGASVLAELDPSLAVRFDAVSAHAGAALAEFEGLLGADHADVAGAHAVEGYLHVAIAELEVASDAERDGLLALIATYINNFGIAASIVECQGVIAECVRDAELAPMLAMLGVLSVDVVEIGAAGATMADLVAAMGAAHQELAGHLDAIEDITAREAAKATASNLMLGLNGMVPECGILKILGGIAIGVVNDFAEGQVLQVLRPGATDVEEVASMVSQADAYTSKLNALVKYPKQEFISQALGMLTTLEGTLGPAVAVDAAADAAMATIDRMRGLGQAMLAGPAPKLSLAPGLVDRVAALSLEVTEVGYATVDTITTFDMQLAGHRAENPNVYAEVGR